MKKQNICEKNHINGKFAVNLVNSGANSVNSKRKSKNKEKKFSKIELNH